MRNLRKAEVKGKRVLVRVDFNTVKLSRGEERIEESLPAIKYLLKNGAKVILMTHLETYNGEHPSTRKLISFLKKTYFRGEKNLEMLENLRKDPGEEKCSPVFAKKIAKLGEVYVNEAFSTSHRRHASIVLLPRFLPAYAGFLFEREIKILSRVFHPPHPFTLILGGGKIETKLPLLKSLLPKVDRVLLGGALLNRYLLEKKPLPSKKIILPEDFIISGKKIMDVGPESFQEWGRIIKKSKLVVWNGPLGDPERGFSGGTKRLISILMKTKSKIIIGGGDTLGTLPKKPPRNIFVSTGGGAMLEYLVKKTLPGIEALR